MQAVIDQYTQEGWQVCRTPNCINHFIAFRKRTLHFVHTDKAKHSSLEQSTFVQNAFSNAAIPIYAQSGHYINANTNTPVIIKKRDKVVPNNSEVTIRKSSRDN